MRADLHRMVKWLGVKSAASEQEILRIVEERLAASVIKRLLGLGLDRAEIDATVIPSRTLQHRRSRRERLTLEESDRVLRLVRILSTAEAVYGNRERHWVGYGDRILGWTGVPPFPWSRPILGVRSSKSCSPRLMRECSFRWCFGGSDGTAI